MKKIVAAFLCALLLLGAVTVSMPMANAYTFHSSAEAVSWIKACGNEKWWVDIDDYAGCQCVDLIMAYYDYLLGYHINFNACDYAFSQLPSGWYRDKTPAPGAVVIWPENADMGNAVAGPVGHIGLVYKVSGSTIYTVETNADTQGHDGERGYSYAKFFTRPSKNAVYIHPDFQKVPKPPETDPVDPDDPCAGYVDIDRGSWYHSAADFVLECGIMGSTTTDANVFEPYTACTRAMIATVLYSMEGKPEVSYQAKFPDVKEGQWFTNAIMWAYENGVVTGYDNGKFGPNDKVTREQMAVILMAYTEKVKNKDTTETADLTGFADANKVTWSEPYIAWAVAEGLISGKVNGGKTCLDPQGNATRAESAAILRSFISNIIEFE